MFILFGILILKGGQDEEAESNLFAKRAFVSGFLLIGLSFLLSAVASSAFADML